MANLTHIFNEGQKVVCSTEDGFKSGVVKEVYEDHIIVDIPSISDHMWYEEGWNIGSVYPEYDFDPYTIGGIQQDDDVVSSTNKYGYIEKYCI